MGNDQERELDSLQERLQAAVVKATTTATANTNKFQVNAEIKQMATDAATCKNLFLEEGTQETSLESQTRI